MTLIGNPTKSRLFNEFLSETVTLAIPANTTNPVTITPYVVPNERGPIRAIEIYVDDDTLAELVKSVLNISSSSIGLIKNTTLLEHSAPYANSKKPIICNIPMQDTVNVSGINASTTQAFTVAIVFRFYNPDAQYITELKED